MEYCEDYVVVEFTNTEGPTEVGTVYKNWLFLNDDGDLFAYWPPIKELKKFLAKKIPSHNEWPVFKVNILLSCNDLISAWAAEKKAEMNSEVSQSDTNNKGRGQRKKLKTWKSSSKHNEFWPKTSDEEDLESDLSSVEMSPLRKKNSKTLSGQSSPIETTIKNTKPTSMKPAHSTPVAKRTSQCAKGTPTQSTQKIVEESFCPTERDSDYNQLKERIGTLERTVERTSTDVQEALEILRFLQAKATTASQENQPSPDDNDDVEEMEESLPMKTLEEVFELENSLTDEKKRKVLTAYLSKIGGGTVDNNVQRILVRMFTNEAAQYFSWEGKSGKQRLDQLMMVKIMSRVIKGGPLRSTFTEKVFENRVKEWFRQARTRLNAKKNKALVAAAASLLDEEHSS